jgi:hypothetical protein
MDLSFNQKRGHGTTISIFFLRKSVKLAKIRIWDIQIETM